MRALICDRVEDFAQRVTPFLMQREAERNWFLGILARMPADAVMCAAEDAGGEIVGVSVMTPPWHMGISSMPATAVEALVDELTRRNIDVRGIQGDVASVDAFSERWKSSHPVTLRFAGSMGVYQLERVIPPAKVSGACRLATMEDLELLLRWHEEFQRDCNLPRQGNFRELIETAIGENRRFLWCDADPLSMTGVAGPTPNGIRIQAVYTPAAYRKRGYASALVAEVSQRLLDSGRRFCFLFTDLANPTSNKIYQQIGYRHVADAKHIAFDPC
jgi:uncharacterized protein